MDQHLPGICGGQLARSIASHNARVPIIGLTARSTSIKAKEISDAGVFTVLTKPVTAERLIHQIRATLTDAH